MHVKLYIYDNRREREREKNTRFAIESKVMKNWSKPLIFKLTTVYTLNLGETAYHDKF